MIHYTQLAGSCIPGSLGPASPGSSLMKFYSWEFDGGQKYGPEAFKAASFATIFAMRVKNAGQFIYLGEEVKGEGRS